MMSAKDNIFIVKMGFSRKEFISHIEDFLSILSWHPGIFHFFHWPLEIHVFPSNFGNPSKILTTFTLTPGIFYCYPHQGCRGTKYIFLFWKQANVKASN